MRVGKSFAFTMFAYDCINTPSSIDLLDTSQNHIRRISYYKYAIFYLDASQNHKQRINISYLHMLDYSLEVKTNPVILLNEPQSSTGGLFSALLLVRSDRIFKFKIRIMSQNLTYATHLSSCHRCTEITEEIHCWIIGGRGSESAQLESFPLTCYIPGRLPCSTLCRLGSVKYLINVDCQEATGNSTKTNTT